MLSLGKLVEGSAKLDERRGLVVNLGGSCDDGAGVELADDQVDHRDEVAVRLVRYPRARRLAAWISELRPSSSPLDTWL